MTIPIASVAFRAEEYHLTQGETLALAGEVIVAPSDATNPGVIYTKDASDAISLTAEGQITALAPGVSTLTVTSQDNPTLTAQCRVHVHPQPLSVEIINLPSPLTVGNTYTLQARVSPAEALQEVTWSVEGIGATLSGSDLTVAERTHLRITATTKVAPFASDSKEVDVNAPLTHVPLDKVILDIKEITMQVGETKQLDLTFEPSNATNKNVQWTINPQDVASVVGGLITANAPGQARITVTSEEGNFTDVCEVRVVPADLSSVQGALLADVSVSPNPFAYELRVSGAASVLRYELHNAQGHTVLRGEHAGSDRFALFTEHLPSGLYLLRLYAADGVRVLPVVRQ